DRLRWIPHFVSPVGERGVENGGAVAFAGRLSPEKGVDTLIDAVARVEGPVRLDVAGEGPDRARLGDLADRVGGGRIRFLGRLDSDAIDALISESVAVVVPSRWYENQPMTVLEAFARGTPVIATSIGGTPELVRQGTDGFLVPPDDPAALARALQDVLD